MGSYHFYAPEMLDPKNRGQLVKGHKTDIWALGITLFYIITGFNPYENTDNIFKLQE